MYAELYERGPEIEFDKYLIKHENFIPNINSETPKVDSAVTWGLDKKQMAAYFARRAAGTKHTYLTPGEI